jgi:hypothetical protein
MSFVPENRPKPSCTCNRFVAMWHVPWTKTIELTYENLGIRPLLIDKLSNYSIPKDGVLLPVTKVHPQL